MISGIQKLPRTQNEGGYTYDVGNRFAVFPRYCHNRPEEFGAKCCVEALECQYDLDGEDRRDDDDYGEADDNVCLK